MKESTKIEQVNVEKLIPYAKNSRKHSEAQVGQIAASIKEFGFINPILIGDDNTLIAGHGRLLAAQKLELKTVPCIRAKHLTSAQCKAYVIVDNRLSETSEWDKEMLKLEIEDLSLNMDFDLSQLGFSLDEIGALLNDGWNDANFSVPDEEPKAKDKEKPQITCPYCNKQFEK